MTKRPTPQPTIPPATLALVREKAHLLEAIRRLESARKIASAAVTQLREERRQLEALLARGKGAS